MKKLRKPEKILEELVFKSMDIAQNHSKGATISEQEYKLTLAQALKEIKTHYLSLAPEKKKHPNYLVPKQWWDYWLAKGFNAGVEAYKREIEK